MGPALHNSKQLIHHRWNVITSQMPVRAISLLMEAHESLMVYSLGCLMFITTYGSVLAWWFCHGLSLSSEVRSSQDFVTFQDPKTQITFFDAHVPFCLFQVSGALGCSGLSTRLRLDFGCLMMGA